MHSINLEPKKEPLGVSSLDTQRTLLNQFLVLIDQADSGLVTPRMLGPMLNDLYDYFYQHCLYEEQLMEEVGYAGLEQHRSHHREMLNRVRILINRLKTQREPAGGPNMLDLQETIADHMELDDREFVLMLRAQGID